MTISEFEYCDKFEIRFETALGTDSEDRVMFFLSKNSHATLPLSSSSTKKTRSSEKGAKQEWSKTFPEFLQAADQKCVTVCTGPTWLLTSPAGDPSEN
jgi:hypothetical protein